MQERCSCLGTRQKRAESPGQVRRLSRHYHELSRRNQNPGTLSQCILQLTLQEEDAELCRLHLEGFLKPVYTNVDCNVLLRASKQESQQLTLNVRLLPFYHIFTQMVLVLLLIVKSEGAAGLLQERGKRFYNKQLGRLRRGALFPGLCVPGAGGKGAMAWFQTQSNFQTAEMQGKFGLQHKRGCQLKMYNAKLTHSSKARATTSDTATPLLTDKVLGLG